MDEGFGWKGLRIFWFGEARAVPPRRGGGWCGAFSQGYALGYFRCLPTGGRNEGGEGQADYWVSDLGSGRQAFKLTSSPVGKRKPT